MPVVFVPRGLSCVEFGRGRTGPKDSAAGPARRSIKRVLLSHTLCITAGHTTDNMAALTNVHHTVNLHGILLFFTGPDTETRQACSQ